MYQVAEINGKIFMTDMHGRPDTSHAFRNIETAQRAAAAAIRTHNQERTSLARSLCQTGGDL